MKRQYLAIIFLMLFYSSHAQDPQLFENPWYLQNVIVNGENNYPPSNSEVVHVTSMIVEPIFFETIVCDVFSANLNFIGTTQFNFFNAGMTFDDCTNQENIDFEVIYLDNFYESNFDKIFNYTIDISESLKILTITNYESNHAVYVNEILANQDFTNYSFTIYPNPVQDLLTIDNNSTTEIASIKLYDVLGRIVLVEKGNVKQLDVSSLNNGIFIIKIETDECVITKKIIKE